MTLYLECLTFLIFFYYFFNLPQVQHVNPTLPIRFEDLPIAASNVYRPETNATFDFGKVYLINLDERHDRRDQLAIMTSLSGLQFERVPGFRLTSREQTFNGFPRYSPDDMPLSKLACYRAHANVWRAFLEDENQPATALILEDDVDWDVNIKNIMSNFKAPLYALQRAIANQSIDDYYPSWTSSQWDILRLGTCREPPHVKEFKRVDVNLQNVPYLLMNDEGVPEREWIAVDHTMVFDTYGIPISSILEEEVESRRRIIQLSNYPVCLHAYAITRIGAAKLLYLTSQGLIDGANDLTIAEATQDGKLDSFSFTPPPFSQWKSQNNIGNSDNGGTNTDPLPDEDGPSSFSWNIRDSIRVEISSIL
ncbi:uncharacterized protein FA14DRAFT_175572 [Meira miltonrushii]|uniref:Glycosyl transferase family 25 domain-containing protein n=1 Tax=Meira miltonrushii TaxID=1280837 RepID=A0A316V1N5_9BASI|nr:uncharacterized protein FA14DRAFT_175572 [Meira miltonrushii]PWN31382.1 hypothetical protein FA14DRAFT_175572 [Meira miltonrushii]